MRPIRRGESPQENYNSYLDARMDLRDRIGPYCVYCECYFAPSAGFPRVDHIHPQSRHPERINDWQNLLFACDSCNGAKKAFDPAQELPVFWPHLDNTWRVFFYRNGFVMPHPDLEEEEHAQASRTLAMVGLDRFDPSNPPKPGGNPAEILTARLDAWNLAARMKTKYDKADHPEQLANDILELAKKTGHWSYWMTLFQKCDPIRERLMSTAHFPGTRRECLEPGPLTQG
ncbi:MAG: HNH endonuclease [Magnetococcales bacterium]|nr:HNH endonuclease [Magnetococcales bacterium]